MYSSSWTPLLLWFMVQRTIRRESCPKILFLLIPSSSCSQPVALLLVAFLAYLGCQQRNKSLLRDFLSPAALVRAPLRLVKVMRHLKSCHLLHQPSIPFVTEVLLLQFLGPDSSGSVLQGACAADTAFAPEEHLCCLQWTGWNPNSGAFAKAVVV